MYAATSYFFSVSATGVMRFNYMFTGDNPETCMGITMKDWNYYILLESASKSYTKSGWQDSIIVELNSMGEIMGGKYLTFNYM